MTMNKIDDLIERVRRIGDGKITAYFKDGSKQLLEPLECLDLVIKSPDAVERFVGGDGNGKLPDLFTDLLTMEVYPNDAD